MPLTPVDDHTEEFEQLAGLVALDILEGDELARYERHAATCARCRLMERLDREALARAAPEMEPSPDFKARLMRRAAEELAATEPTRQRPSVKVDSNVGTLPGQPATAPPTKVVPFWRRSAWASALAAIFALALVTAGAFTYENQVIATFSLSGDLPGSATVAVRRSGAAELDMNGVPEPDPGFLYEAWVIPQDGQPIPAGITTSGSAKLPLPGDVRGKTVAITKERTRVEAPTSAPILATQVQL